VKVPEEYDEPTRLADGGEAGDNRIMTPRRTLLLTVLAWTTAIATLLAGAPRVYCLDSRGERHPFCDGRAFIATAGCCLEVAEDDRDDCCCCPPRERTPNRELAAADDLVPSPDKVALPGPAPAGDATVPQSVDTPLSTPCLCVWSVPLRAPPPDLVLLFLHLLI